jgi:hypothetical protein
MRSLRALLCLALAIAVFAVPARSWAGAPEDPPPAPAGGPSPAPEHPDAPTDGHGHEANGHAGASPIDAKVYAAALRERLASIRTTAVAKLEAKIEASQGAQLDRISEILFYVALAGFLLLLSPLWLRRRFPGKTAVLFKYSALAAFTFAFAIVLFSVALLVLRESQNALGSQTNPKIAIVEGMFHALDDSAEELAPLGPDLIEPTLAQVAAGSDEPIQVLLLQNLQKLHERAKFFETVAGMIRGAGEIMGYVPILLSFLAVALFLRNFVPLMREIISLPARAATGEAHAGRRLLGQTLRQVGRELLVIVCFVVALLGVTVVSGFILAHVVAPAMSALLWFLISAFLYLQVQPDAATGLMLTSLIAVVVYLVLNVAIVTIASILFLAKIQKIFRGKFHAKVPLGAHARFWRWGALSFAWAEVLPFLFVLATAPAVVRIFERFLHGDDPSYLGAMLVSGAIFAVGLPVVFWAARGVKALVFLLRYKQAPAEAGMPATAAS